MILSKESAYFIYRMIDIGEYFCNSKSEALQDSLKVQSLNYFKNHHRYVYMCGTLGM